jgi:hypothetical protein
LPARDRILVPLIAEALIKNPGLGANQLYRHVSPLYYEKKGTKLHTRHFFKYLVMMIHEIGAVEERGGNKPGKQAELYLTEKGKTQYHQNSLDLPSIRDETQTSSMKDGIPQDLKALYAIILYFNQGVKNIVHTEGELEWILRGFGLSMSSLIRSDKSVIKSDSEDILRVIFQSPREDAIISKDVFLRSDIHERGTTQYRCRLRGITCEAILENRDLRVFNYLGFTSKDIKSAIGSLCSLNALKPMGSLRLTIANDVIYKIDKSIFDFIAALDIFHDDDLFSRVKAIMTEIWSNFRSPTDNERDWLYFVYGNKEADRLLNNAYEARNKITGGQGMTSYIRKIRREDKTKLNEINKRVDAINEKVTEIVNHLDWVQETYRTTKDIPRDLLKNIFETIYPDFFVGLHLPRFGHKN